MWELAHKEGREPKNWWFWAVVLEKILESPLDCKDIKPINPKGIQPWIFIGRTDAKAETPIFCPPDAKSQVIGKDPEAGKIEGRRRGWGKMRWLNSITDAMDLSLREAWHAAVLGVAKSWTWLSDWTATAATALLNCEASPSEKSPAWGLASHFWHV